MGRPKSLIASMEWTVAARAHDCRSNKNHRLEKGDRRLTVKEDGSDLHYCVTCATTFLASDIKRLQNLLAAVER